MKKFKTVEELYKAVNLTNASVKEKIKFFTEELHAKASSGLCLGKSLSEADEDKFILSILEDSYESE